MKTNYFFSKKLSIYSLFGFVMLLVSCGSSKNTSYDNDGIYGGTAPTKEVASSDNKYQEYFSDLNKENQEIFTDVESYSTTNDTVKRVVVENNNGWGSNPSNVTINVYDNSWGYGGWNNYWYGNNWAWNNWY